eukprot:scaffold3544_cov159-Amphora_coffeaeformis.AAC.1
MSNPQCILSDHYVNHSSDQTQFSDGLSAPSEPRCEQPKQISGVEATEAIPPSNINEDSKQAEAEFDTAPLTNKTSIESHPEAVKADYRGISERRKSNDTPESPSRSRQRSPLSLEKSPSRKSTRPIESSEISGFLPAVPLSPRRPLSSRVNVSRRPRTSSSKSSQSKEDVVISWSRSPDTSSPSRSSKRQSIETRRKSKDSSAERTRKPRISSSRNSYPKEYDEVNWSRSPKQSTKRNSITGSSDKLFASQRHENSSSRSMEGRNLDNDALVELTDREDDETKKVDKKAAKPTTPCVFVSSFLESAPKIASDTESHLSQADGTENLMVEVEQAELSKDFSKQNEVREASPTGSGQEDQKVLRRDLEDAIARLEDAKRIVLKLEDEVTRLTREMQKCKLEEQLVITV